MCGLYSFRKSVDEARSLFNYLEQPIFPPRQYITPGGPIAIVRQIANARHFALVRWGFVPSWAKEISPGKPLINARSETVLVKPSFKHAIRRRRCLFPTDGFYEWQGTVPGKKQAYFITRPDDSPFAFAGIWEHWMAPDGSELETAAMITIAPNAEVSAIHDRSPVVIHPYDFDTWLNCENERDDAALKLMVTPPDGFFKLQPTVIARSAKPAATQPILPKAQLNFF